MVEYYLDLVGLGDAMRKHPKELSGGMQQRVGIARAFAVSPQFLLLDEPFGRLDSLTRMELQDVLLELIREKEMTSMMVTHDVDEALYLSDRIVMMTNGPAAKVGEILEIDFPRPRVRADVLEHPRYYELRGRLLAFLEEQAEPDQGTVIDEAKSDNKGKYPKITHIAEKKAKERLSKLA
jgi:ABC-type nitrate/sulfonate/bicarbonate transport system ATPase subunit